MADEQTLILEEINVTVVEDLIANLIEQHHNVQAIGIGIPGVAHNGVIGICDVPEPDVSATRTKAKRTV